MKQKSIDKLLKGYFEAHVTLGKPLNALQKLKIRLELQNADVNKVLEILEEIDKIKQLAKYHSISIDANVHVPATPNPNPTGIYNGTIYQDTSDMNPWKYHTTWWGSTSNGNSNT